MPRGQGSEWQQLSPSKKKKDVGASTMLVFVLAAVFFFLLGTILIVSKMELGTASLSPSLASLAALRGTVSFEAPKVAATATTSAAAATTVHLPVLDNTAASESNGMGQESATAMITRLFQLGLDDPARLVQLLSTEDPFNTNSSSVSTSEGGGGGGFVCPVNVEQRIDYPSIVKKTNAERFRNGDPDAFVFYQHLRKAGGTGFCELAKTNMARGSVPPYYCMPDDRGSLATPPWNEAAYLKSNLLSKNWRIAANEWDAFYEEFFDLQGAVFATTFRHPIDRWYSQYRFEHLEHRDGSSPDAPRMSFIRFYLGQQSWTLGKNYYVNTFEGTADDKSKLPQPKTGDFYWTYHKFRKTPVTLSMFLRSLENVRRFDLVLVTEYLEVSSSLIEKVLGWKAPPKQVLPHEIQAVRSSHKNIPAKELLPPADYKVVAEENVFDLLLFEISKRIFLERLHCSED